MTPETKREIAAAGRRAAVRVANGSAFFSRKKATGGDPEPPPEEAKGPEKGEAVKSQKT